MIRSHKLQKIRWPVGGNLRLSWTKNYNKHVILFIVVELSGDNKVAQFYKLKEIGNLEVGIGILVNTLQMFHFVDKYSKNVDIERSKIRNTFKKSTKFVTSGI